MYIYIYMFFLPLNLLETFRLLQSCSYFSIAQHAARCTWKRRSRSCRASAAKCCSAWPISSSVFASKRSWASKSRQIQF